MAETEGFGLTDEDEIDAARRDRVHQIEQLVLALGGEVGFKFRALVEVIFDGALVAARDEDHVGHARSRGLFDGVLNQGLVDDGQHFLGHRLGGGKKTGAHARDRKDNLANGFHNFFQRKAAGPRTDSKESVRTLSNAGRS